ncbi:CDGSH iron-sulfur domain-containing protein [Streptomyces goshikiensis]|uniref:CDGSH iron-sulfur domain-containing protein n=1 Tax=Streptomyces goshikiensis TaxID=1942 RepID=UPI0039176525
MDGGTRLLTSPMSDEPRNTPSAGCTSRMPACARWRPHPSAQTPTSATRASRAALVAPRRPRRPSAKAGTSPRHSPGAGTVIDIDLVPERLERARQRGVHPRTSRPASRVWRTPRRVLGLILRRSTHCRMRRPGEGRRPTSSIAVARSRPRAKSEVRAPSTALSLATLPSGLVPLPGVYQPQAGTRIHRLPLRVLHGDFEARTTGRRFDVVFSNPPYVPSPASRPPSRGPERAWDAGRDGRAVIDRLCVDAPALLRPGGVLLMVHSGMCGAAETLGRLAGAGMAAEVTATVSVPWGPVLVEGPLAVDLDDGTVSRSDRFVVAVGTCRRSRTYPWGDTSHRRRERAASPPENRNPE